MKTIILSRCKLIRIAACLTKLNLLYSREPVFVLYLFKYINVYECSIIFLNIFLIYRIWTVVFSSIPVDYLLTLNEALPQCTCGAEKVASPGSTPEERCDCSSARPYQLMKKTSKCAYESSEDQTRLICSTRCGWMIQVIETIRINWPCQEFNDAFRVLFFHNYVPMYLDNSSFFLKNNEHNVCFRCRRAIPRSHLRGRSEEIGTVVRPKRRRPSRASLLPKQARSRSVVRRSWARGRAEKTSGEI